jgi:hypothetical protein
MNALSVYILIVTTLKERKLLKGSAVMPERRVCMQRYALQLNSLPGVETTLTTAHRLGQNRTAKNRHSEKRDCSVLVFIISYYDGIRVGAFTLMVVRQDSTAK